VRVLQVRQHLPLGLKTRQETLNIQALLENLDGHLLAVSVHAQRPVDAAHATRRHAVCYAWGGGEWATHRSQIPE
jgi:hypothetical protein